MIAALVLAGGDSRRMGESKALLPFPDVPLVAAQWLSLRAAGLDPLRIVVGADAHRVVAGSGLARENFVRNRSRAGTLFSSLQAGLRALLAADDWPAVVVQPVDALPPHPALVVALAQRFLEGGLLAVTPAHHRRGGHPVILAREVAEEAVGLDAREARLDDVLRRLEAAGAAERMEAYSPDVLWNLNDRAQYLRALRALRAGSERGGIRRPRRRGR
ncbi:MAG TPA: NTP transferase domain-containing protein [Anaeromyxobacteraceae bacterium]|nr:NTP transferase domain-containing protein [Anaeromyxobacteraceae bacterium]